MGKTAFCEVPAVVHGDNDVNRGRHLARGPVTVEGRGTPRVRRRRRRGEAPALASQSRRTGPSSTPRTGARGPPRARSGARAARRPEARRTPRAPRQRFSAPARTRTHRPEALRSHVSSLRHRRRRTVRPRLASSTKSERTSPWWPLSAGPPRSSPAGGCGTRTSLRRCRDGRRCRGRTRAGSRRALRRAPSRS